MQVTFKHKRKLVIECEEHHCGNCNKRDGNLCRLFPKYQRRGWRTLSILKYDNLRTLRDPECLKLSVPLH